MTVAVPWFEDFEIGDDYSDVPAVTITEGHAAIHQAMFGDRLRLPLDHVLSQSVTGHSRALVNPSLVCNLAIGQSTIPSQRVMGNLFYRGMKLQRPAFIGDTLTTTTRVVGLRQNKPREGRPASGMVALEIHVQNQQDETVMLFWRCPMIPCRNPNANTGHEDDFANMPDIIEPETLLALVPDWQFESFRTRVKAPHFSALKAGSSIQIEARDTVTLAPELVRMTLNMAMTHTDATRSVYGQRLVYGGHTIAMAAAQLTRAFPGMLTILGWFRCDHVAPVFEEDVLESQVTIESLLPVDHKQGGGLAVLHVETFACRQDKVKVLDWRLAALFA
ncbi:MaoC family dehydratase [Pseudomonadales bacterium]|nr:MaoC family dehydratase [Pseudomonadales bacterium]MDA9285338.1 MaoC family dehydratase [Pseudomonadales bacterium]MDB4150428.1 MaoC family dehydratase [Pseudomonadales bacterium]MDB9867372.1 MaoC family dehydratase [Pseudomonadales bacterium]MDB9916580.1 MaoC family dehydratase [Pseudomonadales bacterium]|tara:strand:+ start:1607 stop:2605 length:999 start_codon:yes stop_codon:yes gene_type:complete